jgi:hypothetical protein
MPKTGISWKRSDLCAPPCKWHKLGEDQPVPHGSDLVRRSCSSTPGLVPQFRSRDQSLLCDEEVVLSIVGGRKTMSALGAMTMTLLGRPADRPETDERLPGGTSAVEVSRNPLPNKLAWGLLALGRAPQSVRECETKRSHSHAIGVLLDALLSPKWVLTDLASPTVVGISYTHRRMDQLDLWPGT